MERRIYSVLLAMAPRIPSCHARRCSTVDPRGQWDASKVAAKKAMIQKLLKVKNRHCFEEGLVTVLTSFFAVMKGEEDICTVHDPRIGVP
jgi:hypothetical protein